MKIVYVDTSVLGSILFCEPGFEAYQNLLAECKDVFTSALTEVELLSMAKREKVPSHKAVDLLENVLFFYPTRSFRKECLSMFEKGYCRGADAYHIASATYLKDRLPFLTFLTADKKQAKLAKLSGLSVVQG